MYCIQRYLKNIFMCRLSRPMILYENVNLRNQAPRKDEVVIGIGYLRAEHDLHRSIWGCNPNFDEVVVSC